VQLGALAETSVTNEAKPLARENHYVAQALLRRWADDGKRVWSCRLLVSNQRVPQWTRHSVRRIACQRDLYTTVSAGKQVDAFERWISKEFEEPGLEFIEKLHARARLQPRDWRAIARFAALQDMRTPLDFVASMQRWEQETPDVLERSARLSVERIAQAQRLGKTLELRTNENPFAQFVQVQTLQAREQSPTASVKVQVTLGRDFWIARIRYLLRNDGPLEKIEHKWSIAEPAEGEPGWIMSDHPVLRLNFNSIEEYNLEGGWGNRGTEIMMPLSPRHLLYTQVGRKREGRFSFSTEHTRLIQSFLAKRAYRWIFADRPYAWVPMVRPREVSAEQYSEEHRAWKAWHQGQIQEEAAT